jgi:predicted negative regulator of RcsB-dependent stress response
MEVLKEIWTENGPEILSYILTALGYFLIFLARSKSKKTSDVMSLFFKQGITEVKTIDTKLRTDIDAKIVNMQKEYNAAMQRLETAEKRYNNMSNAIAEIIADEEDET